MSTDKIISAELATADSTAAEQPLLERSEQTTIAEPSESSE